MTTILFTKRNFLFSYLTFSLIFILLFSSYSSIPRSFGAYSKAQPSPYGPVVNDPNLTIEKLTTGLKVPTSMAFVGNNDILVLEKNTGQVVRVLDGKIQDTPVLDVAVANYIERGLLGIALSKQPDGKIYAFLFYTEAGGSNPKDGNDYTDHIDPAGNRLYRYQYVDGKLIDPVLLIDLTAIPTNLNRTDHNGGKVVIGPDNNVYVIVGEVGGHRTQAQNIQNGPPPDGLGGVLRVTQNGDVISNDPIFGNQLPLSVYYAMGIRNSFGMDFDPVTGTLWDTENGPTAGDEINMIPPGFNGGWALIQGYAKDDLLGNGATPDDLVYLGKSKYYDPKFVWHIPIGPTALKFLSSDKLGKEYENNMFVGDINNGNLYRFTLNPQRDAISIGATYAGDIKGLADNKIDNPPEMEPIIFASGFGGITDLQVGPDGYLYVLTYNGDIYRILPLAQSNTPKNQPSSTQQQESSVPEGSVPVTIVGIQGDNSYSPNPIHIKAGQTITWHNSDAISHTVTSGSSTDPDEGKLFNSGAILSKQDYSLTFDDPGTYDYFCVYHPSMVGQVIVK